MSAQKGSRDSLKGMVTKFVLSSLLQLYEFFMRATQLEDCENLYHESIERLRGARINLTKKGETIKLMKSTVTEWAQKYEAYREMDKKKQDLEKMVIELACSEINECSEDCR